MRFSPDWWLTSSITQQWVMLVYFIQQGHSPRRRLGAKPLEVWLIVKQRAVKLRALNGTGLGKWYIKLLLAGPCSEGGLAGLLG